MRVMYSYYCTVSTKCVARDLYRSVTHVICNLCSECTGTIDIREHIYYVCIAVCAETYA